MGLLRLFPRELDICNHLFLRRWDWELTGCFGVLLRKLATTAICFQIARRPKGCDIGGAKEPGVIYFPTNWGAKEPQNLPNHRVEIAERKPEAHGSFFAPKIWGGEVGRDEKSVWDCVCVSS